MECVGLAVAYHKTILLAPCHRNSAIECNGSTIDADHAAAAPPLCHVVLQKDHIADRAGDRVHKGIKHACPQLVLVGTQGVPAVCICLFEVGAAHKLDLRRGGEGFARVIVVGEHREHIPLIVFILVHKGNFHNVRAPLCALELLFEAVLLDIADRKELRRLRGVVINAGESCPLHDDLAAPDRLRITQRLPHLHRRIIYVVKCIPLAVALLRPRFEHVVGQSVGRLAADDVTPADAPALMQDVITSPRGIICAFFLIRLGIRIPDVEFGSLLHPCHGGIVAAQLLRCECTDADERLARMHEVVIDDLRQLRPIDAIDISDGIAVFVDAAHTHLITPRRKALKTVDAIDRPIGCLVDAPRISTADRRTI